jgi:lipid-binding SYLF domain-containing protein
MKKRNHLQVLPFVCLLAALFIGFTASAQSDKEDQLMKDAQEAKEDFIKTDDLMRNLFDHATGYVIFPNVGKGAIGVGGAAGNGIVYQNGTVIGTAKMTQVTIGFQFGGQAYREVIFFENQETLDRFKENKIEFTAQASAIAATKGAAATPKYTEGVMIFTQQKGGLMYEASVGGQKFKFTPQ